jgi:hypothetical protein
MHLIPLLTVLVLVARGTEGAGPAALRSMLADMERREPVLLVFYHPGLPLWATAHPVMERLAGAAEGVRVMLEDVQLTPEHVQHFGLREYPTLRLFPVLQGAVFPIDIPFDRRKTETDYLRDLRQFQLLFRDVHGDADAAMRDVVPLLRALDPGALAAYSEAFEAEGRRAAWETKLETVASATTRDDGNASFVLTEDDVDIDHVPARLRQHMLETRLERLEAQLQSSSHALQLRQRRVDFLLALLRNIRSRHDPRIIFREFTTRMRSLLHSGLLSGPANDQLRENLLLELSALQPLLEALRE